MRIVYVDETFHPSYGYQSNPLAKFQQMQGNEIIIVTVSKEQLHPVYRAFGDTGETLDEEDELYQKTTGVKIIRVETKGYFMHRAVFAKKKLFSTVRSLKPNIVFVHCVETLTAMRFLVHKKEWPLMFDSHMLSMASESKFVGLYEAFYRLFFRKIIERHNYFVIRTQDDEYVNKNLGIRKDLTPFISFGTDTLLFKPSSKNRLLMREKYSISQNEFVVLYTGKLTKAKGGMFLAEAFKEEFDTPITLVCVGSPPNDDYGRAVINLFKESKNRIILVETQKYTNLAGYYQMADLSVFPKQCSMSFYDAQACGLPVLSERNNVNMDRCSHNNGINFIQDDIFDFRNKINFFASMDRTKRDFYSKNAISFIKEGYDYSVIAQKYTDYLKKSIENQRKNK